MVAEIGICEAIPVDAANTGVVPDLGDVAQAANVAKDPQGPLTPPPPAHLIEEPTVRLTRSAKRRMDEDATPISLRTRSRRKVA
ncbi:hypothetical protein MKX01_037037 [Papaver californicum]|nr:hypothetical protein MKX01_037037 [Papaver californicum]